MADYDIVIAGEAPVDELVYPSPSSLESFNGLDNARKLRTYRHRSGAALIAEFLRVATPKCKVHAPSFDGSKCASPSGAVRSILDLDVCASLNGRAFTLKMKHKRLLDA
jgi:hypothetical protein